MLRRLALSLALTIVVAGFPSASRAAEMRAAYRDPFAPGKGTVEIQLRGSIVWGDAPKFVGLIGELEGAGRAIGNVSLESPGGAVMEAMKIAAEVRRRRLATGVPRGGMCASACFLIFAAGQGKIVQEGAQVGVHGASFEGRETDLSARITIEMAREASRLGVPYSIIGRMAITPPDEMVWLTRDELATMAGPYGHVLQP